MSILSRCIRAFGLFWWDFLVGDTPELFVATAVIVGLAFLVSPHGRLAVVLLPFVAVVFLVTSTFRGRQRSSGATTSEETSSTES